MSAVMSFHFIRPIVLRRWNLHRRFIFRRCAAAVKATKTEDDHTSKETWKRELIFSLGRDVKLEHKRYSAQKKRVASEHRIVCFIRDNRILQMLSFINTLAKSLPESELKNHGEIFAVSLKHAAEQLSSKMEQGDSHESKEALTFIRKFVGALLYIPLCSNDVVLANGYGLALLKKWMTFEFENFDDHLAIFHAIEQLESRLMEYVNSNGIKQNRMLFNEDVLRVIANYLDFKDQWSVQEISKFGYSEDLPLVNDLMDACPPDEYRGSPFVLDSHNKEHLMEQFRKQLFNEQKLCFAVKNYARNSVEKPMEKLLLEWRWDKALASTFKQMTDKISSVAVKQVLDELDCNAVSDVLLECVIAALCQGNTLVPLQDLQYSLSHSILALSHRDFVKNSLNDSYDMFEKICTEYFRYFYEQDLARQYNLREWWHICTQKFSAKPSFHIPFTNFSISDTDELSAFLIDVILNACKIPENKLQNRSRKNAFSFRNVNIEQFAEEQGNKHELVKMFELNPTLVELIAEHQFESLLFPFHTLPMTLPPRPWMEAGTCGPLYSRSSDVLRNLFDFPIVNVNVEMNKRLKSEPQARPVFDALNDLGATPWIINKPMLKELTRAFDFSFKQDKKELLKGLAIPMHLSTIHIPTIYEYFDCTNVSNISSAEWFRFSKEEHAQMKERNESNSLWCWLMYRIVLANHFRNNILYFPHNMDFRGRVYPISPHLNHMGDDINRCLLKFARGKPMGEKGFDWLKIHCINLTGLMKRRSNADRLAFAEANMNKILQSANDPWAENSWWLESEEPWQTLSACMEIRDVLNSGIHPHDFVSHLPIHQDGSCNGFQHYAALGRDKEGAIEVNLLPTEFPADIYSGVAVRVEQKRTEDEKSEDDHIRELALDLRAHIPEPMPRKIIKQTVMTTIYGVTMYGARLQIKRQLKAIGIPNEKLVKFATYIAQKTLGSLSESFESSMKLKDWFRQCAKSIVQLMQPVEWKTPLGLPVMQPYLKSEKRFDILCHTPITHKQVDAFPPNFVHSLDSTHMMLTTLYCRKRGVTFAAVHDCFWTHASDVDVMNEICREQFIRLHSQPIVENLGEQFRNVYLSKEEMTKMNPESFEKFRRSFTPSNKRGTLDIEQIRDSVYFFS